MFYDLAPPERNAGDGWAYDGEAVEAVGDVRTGVTNAMQVGGRIQCNFYAAVFLTPEGKRVHAFQGLPAPKEMVRQLRETLKKFPEYAKPSPKEAAILKKADENPSDAKAQLAAAREAWAVADREKSRAYLKRARAALPKKPAAWAAGIPYLEARIALWNGKLNAASARLTEAASLDPDEKSGLSDDIAACRARVALEGHDWALAAKLFALVTAAYPDGNRAGESLYFAGLAHHRAGDEESARRFWRRHVEEYPKDRLARRSAISLPGAKAFKNQELPDGEGW